MMLANIGTAVVVGTIGLVVAIGVSVVLGVFVAGFSPWVGVHDGTSLNLRVIVSVGAGTDGNNVGGGNGFRILFGLKNIMVK